jgi:indolepyruvate ferredoxin oxidoreductase beta subunit
MAPDGTLPASATAADWRPAGPVNVIIVGVGGQGVVMVAKVLATLCQRAGLIVKQSEVHGMAKRGGSVFSHVRFGAEVHSPVIARGEADILVALEWVEGLRWLDFLKGESGTFIADTQCIVPPISFRNRQRGARPAYEPTSAIDVIERVGNGFALDATRMAAGLGNERCANTVLLGALSTALPFAREEWLAVLDFEVPPNTVEINRRAFEAGRSWIQTFDRNAAHVAESVSLPVVAYPDHRVEITEAWCKGCDICVKMCPERCLTLNARKIVALADPAACTACRLCEWLCPDYAIRVVAAPTTAG